MRNRVSITCSLRTLRCLGLYFLMSSIISAFSFSLSSSTSTISKLSEDRTLSNLSGDWSNAKQSLRSPKCCVVSVSGLDHHLSTLQQYFCGEDAPSDLDLRMRVRCKDDSIEEVAYQDCSKIYNAVMGQPTLEKDVMAPDNSLENNNLQKSLDFGSNTGDGDGR